MAKNCLLVIDVQEGFINKHTTATLNEILDLVDSVKFDTIVSTSCVNLKGSSFRKILGWLGCEPGSDETKIHEGIVEKSNHILIKYGYSAYTKKLKKILKDGKFDNVYVVGFDTEACVYATVLDLFEAGVTTKVVQDCCASSGGQEYNDAGLKCLTRTIGYYNLTTKSILSYMNR